jgi:hypothetical protein
MSFPGRQKYTFLYHAYALALGGWVKDKNHNYLPIQGVAPSVLSIVGGYSSASETDVNIGFENKYPFGDAGPSDFHIYVGHAYTEVRGADVYDDEHPFGIYQTTVRSVLDEVRINDVFAVEHAETVLQSTHRKPGDGDASEGDVTVGDSNIAGVRVDGRRVKVDKRDTIDRIKKFGELQKQVNDQLHLMEFAGKGGPTGDPWLTELCSWCDENAVVPEDDKDLDYARDVAAQNHNSQANLRYSIFKDVVLDTPRRDQPRNIKTFKSSIFVQDFGRIFLGEVIASHGTKRATMFRINLGCDNCGDVGGSGGSTNGGPMP